MGMIGAPVVLGTAHAPIRGVMEISGEALRLSASRLRVLMTRSSPLRRLLLRYIQATTVQNSQLVLCNARHDTDQRVARWLLLARDRLDGDKIPITHDILSRCLGVRRASVTEALARLKAADAVRAERGYIVITSRHRLEDLTCGCYRIISGEYKGLFKTKAGEAS
jgi:CRP-like cAMP-binding protein